MSCCISPNPSSFPFSPYLQLVHHEAKEGQKHGPTFLFFYVSFYFLRVSQSGCQATAHAHYSNKPNFSLNKTNQIRKVTGSMVNPHPQKVEILHLVWLLLQQEHLRLVSFVDIHQFLSFQASNTFPKMLLFSFTPLKHILDISNSRWGLQGSQSTICTIFFCSHAFVMRLCSDACQVHGCNHTQPQTGAFGAVNPSWKQLKYFWSQLQSWKRDVSRTASC